MTPELARAIMDWYRERQTRDIRTGPGEVLVTVKILPPAKNCPEVLLNELMRRFGSRQFILTSTGWGVPDRLLSEMADQARAVLREAGESAKPATSGGLLGSTEPTSKEEPATETVEPPKIVKRRGFVVWNLCEPAVVANLLKQVSDNHRDRKRVLEALLARPIRYLPRTTAAHVRTVMDLRHDFPNFSPVIEVLAEGLSLRARMKAPLKFPPTLLMGAPGLGKTTFAKELARRLGFELCVRSLAEMTAAFVMIGGSSSWSESRPGLIAVMMADMRDDRAPLLMLDELDKVRSYSNYPPDVALLGLLEDHTARAFREENLDLQLNLAPISYLLTGNRLETIRPEILSRLQQAEIRTPTQGEMRGIVASVDKVLRQEVPGLAAAFAPLAEEVMRSLLVMPPRRLRSILQGAYARVARRDFQVGGKLVLTITDLEAEPGSSKSVAQQAQSSKRYVMPLLVFDPTGWWKVH